MSESTRLVSARPALPADTPAKVSIRHARALIRSAKRIYLQSAVLGLVRVAKSRMLRQMTRLPATLTVTRLDDNLIFADSVDLMAQAG